MSRKPTLQIVDDPLPDHPFDREKAIEGYCHICGAEEVVHDGNLDKVFDWLAGPIGGDDE